MVRHLLERARPKRPALTLPPLACGALLAIVISGCGTSGGAGSQAAALPTMTPTPLPTATPSPNPALTGVASRAMAARNAAGKVSSSVDAGMAALVEALPQTADADFHDAVKQIHIAQSLVPGGGSRTYRHVETLLGHALQAYTNAAREYHQRWRAAQSDVNKGDALLAKVDGTLYALPEARSDSVKLEASNLVLKAEKGAVAPDGVIGSNSRAQIAASRRAGTEASADSGDSQAQSPTLIAAVIPTMAPIYPQVSAQPAVTQVPVVHHSHPVHAATRSRGATGTHAIIHRRATHHAAPQPPHLTVPVLVPPAPAAPAPAGASTRATAVPAPAVAGAVLGNLQSADAHLRASLGALGTIGTQGNGVTNTGVEDERNAALSSLTSALNALDAAQHTGGCGGHGSRLRAAIDAYSTAADAIENASTASQAGDTSGYARWMATALDRTNIGQRLAAKASGC